MKLIQESDVLLSCVCVQVGTQKKTNRSCSKSFDQRVKKAAINLPGFEVRVDKELQRGSRI